MGVWKEEPGGSKARRPLSRGNQYCKAKFKQPLAHSRPAQNHNRVRPFATLGPTPPSFPPFHVPLQDTGTARNLQEPGDPGPPPAWRNPLS